MNCRRLLLAISIAALLPAQALAAVVLREQTRVVVDPKGVTGLRVENPRGLIQVRPSADGRLHLDAMKITTATDSSRAREFARETRVETDTERGRFVVRVRYPQRQHIRVNFFGFFRGDFDFPRSEVRMALEVPPAWGVELSSASGDLEATGLTASQRLATTSGDILVTDGREPVSLSTTSGNITVSRVARLQCSSVSGDLTLTDARGPLDLRTTSGDIEATGVADSVRASSVSGDVSLTGTARGLSVGTTSGEISLEGEASGRVEAHSTSGGVTIALGPAVSRAEVRTVSGDVQVLLTREFGCELEMHTVSGTLDTSVPLRVQNATRRSMSGRVGNGGPAIVLRTSSGDIAVTSGRR